MKLKHSKIIYSKLIAMQVPKLASNHSGSKQSKVSPTDSTDGTYAQSTPKEKGRVGKTWMERGLDDYDLQRVKSKASRFSQHRHDEEQDHIDSLPGPVPQRKKARPEQEFTRNSTPLQLDRDEEQARLEEEIAEAEHEVEEEAAKQSESILASKNTLVRLWQRRASLDVLGQNGSIAWKHSPKQGGFGGKTAYCGEKYLDCQKKRTYQAKLQLATQNKPESEYDDSTDVDEELPQPMERTNSGLGLKDVAANEADVFAIDAGKMTREEFEASAMYAQYLKDSKSG